MPCINLKLERSWHAPPSTCFKFTHTMMYTRFRLVTRRDRDARDSRDWGIQLEHERPARVRVHAGACHSDSDSPAPSVQSKGRGGGRPVTVADAAGSLLRNNMDVEASMELAQQPVALLLDETSLHHHDVYTACTCHPV